MARAEAVIRICKRLSTNGIQVWLTGGWGIDALFGEQARSYILLVLRGAHKMIRRAELECCSLAPEALFDRLRVLLRSKKEYLDDCRRKNP
jgi:hypothetical protein